MRKKRGLRQREHANLTTVESPQARTGSNTVIHAQLIEIREMLVELLHVHGDERAGAQIGGLLHGKEKRISLREAVGLVWGKSVLKDSESTQVHADILKSWATKGINGAVLETQVMRRTWMTSREAVSRFQMALRRG